MWKGHGVYTEGNLTQLQLETLAQDKCHRCVFSLKTITTQSSKGKWLQLSSWAQLLVASLAFPSAFLLCTVCVERFQSGDSLYKSYFRNLFINWFWQFLYSELSCGHKKHLIVNESKAAQQLYIHSMRPWQVWTLTVTTLGEVTCNGRGFGM